MTCKTILQHRARIDALKKNPDIIFDQAAADEVVRFIEGNLHLTGDWGGQPFRLMDWEKYDLIYPIFGLKWRATGLRVIRMVYAQLPRGTGKSAFNAAMLLYYLLFGGTGIDLYCIGSTKTTASNVFQDCVDIYLNSPSLRPYITPRGNEFITELYTSKQPRNTLQVIAADERIQGLRNACTSYDEYHVAPHGKLFDMARQCARKLRQSLVLVITNAGENLNSACYTEYQQAKKILSGEIQDDTYLAYIPEPDDGDAWDDIETARKVNIGLGYTVQDEDLQAELETARLIPAKKHAYIQYRLNQWNIGGAAVWLPFDKYKACVDDYDESDLYGLPIWLGVDKAAKRDLTSICGIVFKDGLPHVLTWNYRPDSKLINIVGEAPYADWLDQGYIFSGGHPEYILDSTLFAYIQDIAAHFDIQAIGFDKAMAGDLMVMCDEKNLPVIEIPQGKMVFTEPINKYEELVLTGGIRFPENPCLAWQFSNAMVDVDQNGLKRFVREHKASNKRNDAMIAITQAIYCWSKQDSKPDNGYLDCTTYFAGLKNFSKVGGIF